MEYVTNDLVARHWDGIFRGLAAMSIKVAREFSAEAGAPPIAQPHRAPLQHSDPPSPPAED